MPKLTDRALETPPKGRVVLSDHQVDGLRVRGGREGWVFWFQGGRTRGPDGTVSRPWTKLGPYNPLRGFGLTWA